MSFLVREAAHRLEKNSLIQITHLINWEKLRYRMGKLGRSGYGPVGYDPIKMFKALVLQAWHSLSDVGLEETLRVRLDFMVITCLTEVPDESTTCRFRNLLIKEKLLEIKRKNWPLHPRSIKLKAK